MASNQPLLVLLPGVKPEHFAPEYLRNYRILSFDQPLVFDQVAGQLRTDYVRWISSMGSQFRNELSYDENFSAWWLTDVFQKDTESGSVFTSLCYGQILSEYLKQNGPIKALEIKGGNASVRKYLGKVGAHFGCSVSNPASSLNLSGIIRAVFARFRIFAKEFWYWFRCPRDKGDHTPAVAWLSFFPPSWYYENGEWKERFYRQLPLAFSERNVRQVYFCWWEKAIRDWRPVDTYKEIQGVTLCFLQSFLSFRDFFRVFIDLRRIKIFLKIDKNAQKAPSLFLFKGIDAYDLLREDLIQSLIGGGIERHLLAYDASKRYLSLRKPKLFISFLESYPFSRAVFAAFKTYSTQTKLVALQHASITPLKLWFSWTQSDVTGSHPLPVADLFICHGDMSKRIFEENGVPAERIVITGDWRTDHLFSARVRTGTDKSNRPRILIAGTYDSEDSEALIKISAEAFRNQTDYDVVIRSHPNCDLRPISGRHGLDYSLYDREPLSDSLAKTDIVISTYSSVADEAFVMGIPVVTVVHSLKVNMSAFYGATYKGVFTAYDSKDLSRIIAEIKSKPVLIENEEFVRERYFSLDTRGTERVLAAISNILPLR